MKPSPATHITINNLTAGALELPPIMRSKVDTTGRSVFAQLHAAVCLIPGRNFVARTYWDGLNNAEHTNAFGEVVKTHERTLRRLLDNKQIEVSEDPAELAKRIGPDLPRSLKEIAPEMRVELVRDAKSADRKLLIGWRDEAQARRDSELIEAIDHQLEKIGG